MINVDHPVLRAEIEHRQAQFADHLAQGIGERGDQGVREQAVGQGSRTRSTHGVIPSKDVEDKLRSEAALTMGLLGLMGEEAILAPRIGGKFRKRRTAE